MAVREYSWESVIRGHHVYKAIWMPKIGEILKCKQERGNPEDLYAVSVLKDDTIVGQVPREKSRVVWYFLEHDGTVTCQVIDGRKHGKGLEVPCMYRFTRKKRKIEKLRKLLATGLPQNSTSSDLP